MKKLEDISFFHRVRLPDGTYTPGVVNHGPDGGDWPTTRFGLPEDLIGKSVLDVGTYDGFFAFEAERRGAKSVWAVDAPRSEGYHNKGTDGFEYLKEVLKSEVLYYDYDIIQPPGDYLIKTKYDLVMCFGVLYHTYSPMKAMVNLAKLTKMGGTCLLETAVTDRNDVPMLHFMPGHDDDETNFLYPNEKWVHEVANHVGFECETIFSMGTRMTFRMTRVEELKPKSQSVLEGRRGPESEAHHAARLSPSDSRSFYDKFMTGRGLDIGYRGYVSDTIPVLATAAGIDTDYPGYDGKILPFGDETQDYVYTSHVLEHIEDRERVLKEWFRVLKVGGHLVTCVPHKFLYERKAYLPSRWNLDHKIFFTPGDLLSLIEVVLSPNSYRIRYVRDNDDGFDYSKTPAEPSTGNCEIELVIQKIKEPSWRIT